MADKKKVVVVRPFKDKDGKERKVGERIEVDSNYAQEIIKDGSVREDPNEEQSR